VREGCTPPDSRLSITDVNHCGFVDVDVGVDVGIGVSRVVVGADVTGVITDVAGSGGCGSAGAVADTSTNTATVAIGALDVAGATGATDSAVGAVATDAFITGAGAGALGGGATIDSDACAVAFANAVVIFPGRRASSCRHYESGRKD
jgi:hypothetical protein